MVDLYALPVDNDATLAGVRELAHDLAKPTHIRIRALRMLCNAYGLLHERTRPKSLVVVRYTFSPRPRTPEDDERDREFNERHAANVRVVNDLNQIARNEAESDWHRLTAWELLGKIGDLFRKVQDSLHFKLIYRKPPPQQPQQQAEPEPDSASPNSEPPDNGHPDDESSDSRYPNDGHPGNGCPNSARLDDGHPDNARLDDGRPDSRHPGNGRPNSERPDGRRPDI